MDTLELTSLIDVGGAFPPRGGRGDAANVLGLVHHFAGQAAIFGAHAGGGYLPIEHHQGLYALLGTGEERDGRFAIPELRGRLLVGHPAGAAGPDGSRPVRYLVATQAARRHGFPLLGMVMPFLARFVPDGWMEADGRLLAVDQHRDLFDVIGTQFGGDGAKDFALPDLRGAVPVGAGPGLAPGTRVPGGVQGLALRHLVALTGVFGLPEGYGGFPQDYPAWGEVVAYAGNDTPEGFHDCDGALLPVHAQQVLFHIVGTSYGGDGRATFALPDLAGRAILAR